MRTENDIRTELDRATERRGELWRELSRGGRNPALSDELATLQRRIDELWEELRSVRVRRRFGPPEPIRARADRDRRIERELDRLTEARRRLDEAA